MRLEGAAVVALGLVGAGGAAAQPAAGIGATEMRLADVEVVGTTPLPGVGTPLDHVPSNVQVIPERGQPEAVRPTVTDAIERNSASAFVSTPGGNPYQQDVFFRGYATSPLLGASQGLSVFVDGVRVNESFGDGVNWDLIPRIAVTRTTIIPGSNPVFGLNTLGGALALETKRGRTDPGTGFRAYGGSFGRWSLEAEQGGAQENTDYYVAGTLFREKGWREHSESSIGQLFGRFGLTRGPTDLDLSVTAADTELSGTQALPLSMLGNPKQPYTWPDTTRNRMLMVNLRGRHDLGADRLLVGNVYVRSLSSKGLYSNVNDDCAQEPCDHDAINNGTQLRETRAGAALQATTLQPLAGLPNELTLGVSFDSSSASFDGTSQEAQFDDTRQAVGIEGFENETSLRSTQRYARVYVTDTLNLTDRLHLMGSLAYNWTRVTLSDRSGTQPELDGSHAFSRFVPAVGLSWSSQPGESWFASASEGMRVPTPIELACADPAAPCTLPNVFLADPPLKPVIARTLEAGVRKVIAPGVRLDAAVFRSELQDDIQFVSTGGATSNAGYFQNVGKTRRQGGEVGLVAARGPWGLQLRYAYVDATFQSTFTEFSPFNSSANASGDIVVQPGARMPTIPQQSFKMRLQYAFANRLVVGGNVTAFSWRYARGDENNQDANGKVPGYALLDLDARWSLGRGWSLFATATNLLDQRYAGFGVLGGNFFTGSGNTFDASAVRAEQFRTPGAPRALWVGVTYRFGDGQRP